MAKKITLPSQGEIRELSTVKHPTMVVMHDADGTSLNAVIVFVRQGESTLEAEQLGAGELVPNVRMETHLIPMPDDFNAEDYGLYWDIAYIG